LIYFTVFDVDLHERFHYPSPFNDWSLFFDLVSLIFIILPLFVLSVQYLTSPVIDGPYRVKWNTLLAPIGAIPVFFFTDFDILYMTIVVLIQNLWVAWKQLDGNDDEYTWMQYYRDEAASRSSKPWAYDRILTDSIETLSMFGDPTTAANIGRFYR
jgi:hypothetical protein